MRPRFSPALLAMISVSILAMQSTAAFAARPKTTYYSGRIGKSLKIEMRLTEEPIMETNNGETYQRGVRYSGSYSYSKEGGRLESPEFMTRLGQVERSSIRESSCGKRQTANGLVTSMALLAWKVIDLSVLPEDPDNPMGPDDPTPKFVQAVQKAFPGAPADIFPPRARPR